jgi:nucleoid-associated protein YgaU
MKGPTHAYMGPEKHTYQLNRIMNKTPLALFSGLVVAAAATSGYFAYQNTVAPASVPAAVASKALEPVPAAPPAPAAPNPADPAPSFDTARVSPGGDAVVAGRAAPGADVALLLNGAVIGTGKADEAGEFVIVPAGPLAAGEGILALETKHNGSSIRSEQTVAVVVKSKPTVEARVMAAPAVAIAQPDPQAPSTTLAVTVEVPAKPAAAAAQTITIQPGNTLWRLSRDLYGEGRNYSKLVEANRSQIKNPRLIFPGQILTAPTKTGN